jgi:UDP-N-acetylmuramoyl-tripeptide--D-alanyl-D-alanine ligase
MARAVAGVFPGAKRTRIVALPSGAKAIDDCYNANPASMELALALLTQIARGARAFAALGDMFELGDHAPEAHRRVGRVAAKAGLAGLVAIGAHAELVIEEARAAGLPRAAGVVAEGPAEAVAVLKGWLRAGDYVLVKGSRGMRMERVLSGLAGEG